MTSTISSPLTAVTAFVLAGGKSTRMGKDKAFLELAGRPLIAHAVALAQAVTNHVRIVGDPAKFSAFGEVLQDVFSGRGPLGGIHAGLASSSCDLNLILGVDLPFVQPRFLQFLISQAHGSSAVVTLPLAGGHLQTLCAVYRKQFSTIAEQALRGGKNKIDALFAKVPTRIIEGAEMLRAGFKPAMFLNLNTPEEWEHAVREFALPPQRLS